MCAYNLMKEKINFILVDSKYIGLGVSSNTTAQVSIAHDGLYEQIKKNHGKNKALKYLKSQIEGLNIIKNIIKEENINCDLHEESSVLTASNHKNIKILKNQFKILKNYCEVKLDKSTNILKDEYQLEIEKQITINPMKYMMSIRDILLKENIKLYEQSKVTKINKQNQNYEVTVNNKYIIKANHIIMACHYPFINPDNLYFAKIYQSKSYVISFKTEKKINKNYVSLDPPYYYIRSYDENTLIIGGNDHITGKNIENPYKKLEDKIYKIDINAKIEKKWSTEDCMTIDSLPFIDKYSKKNKNIYLVSGFQKWGFTNSHIASQNTTKMIQNKNYDTLYKSKRYTLIRNLKSTFKIIIHTLDGIVINRLLLRKYDLKLIKVDSGKPIIYKNKKVLVYRKSQDKYIFLKNKCTHMGCTLLWNDIDKTWESKCHGSIFDKYGNVLIGPAIEDLEEIFF